MEGSRNEYRRQSPFLFNSAHAALTRNITVLHLYLVVARRDFLEKVALGIQRSPFGYNRGDGQRMYISGLCSTRRSVLGGRSGLAWGVLGSRVPPGRSFIHDECLGDKLCVRCSGLRVSRGAMLMIFSYLFYLSVFFI